MNKIDEEIKKINEQADERIKRIINHLTTEWTILKEEKEEKEEKGEKEENISNQIINDNAYTKKALMKIGITGLRIIEDKIYLTNTNTVKENKWLSEANHTLEDNLNKLKIDTTANPTEYGGYIEITRDNFKKLIKPTVTKEITLTQNAWFLLRKTQGSLPEDYSEDYVYGVTSKKDKFYINFMIKPTRYRDTKPVMISIGKGMVSISNLALEAVRR